MHEGLHDEKGVGGFDEPVGFHPDEPFIGVIPYNARLLGRKLADSWCTMMGDLFCVLFKAVHKFPESPYSRQPHEPPRRVMGSGFTTTPVMTTSLLRKT